MSDVTANRVVIAGGSGFLGLSLATYLTSMGRGVVVLSRSRPVGRMAHVHWDGRTLGPWTEAIDGAAAVVNLAGRTVDCVKTPDHRDEILRSRVESTAVLGRAMRAVAAPPPVWVQMGTAHIYGDPPDIICDEDSPTGLGLAPDVGRAWEAAFTAAKLPEQRGVVLRTGFVIGRGGGALGRLKTVVRLGLGGTVGSGHQGMSWIHELDMNRLLARAIDDPALDGVYNACTPSPISQRRFMAELRRAMRVPIGLPALGWLVRLGAPLVLRTDPELALYGRYVSKRLADAGFDWRFGDLAGALADLLDESHKS